MKIKITFLTIFFLSCSLCLAQNTDKRTVEVELPKLSAQFMQNETSKAPFFKIFEFFISSWAPESKLEAKLYNTSPFERKITKLGCLFQSKPLPIIFEIGASTLILERHSPSRLGNFSQQMYWLFIEPAVQYVPRFADWSSEYGFHAFFNLGVSGGLAQTTDSPILPGASYWDIFGKAQIGAVFFAQKPIRVSIRYTRTAERSNPSLFYKGLGSVDFGLQVKL